MPNSLAALVAKTYVGFLGRCLQHVWLMQGIESIQIERYGVLLVPISNVHTHTSTMSSQGYGVQLVLITSWTWFCSEVQLLNTWRSTGVHFRAHDNSSPDVYQTMESYELGHLLLE